MLELFTIVALTTDLPAYQLKAGDIGAIVDTPPQHYVVEFMTLLGKTVAVVEVPLEQIRPIGEWEMANARPLA